MNKQTVTKFGWIAFHMKAIEGMFNNAKTKFNPEIFDRYDYANRYKTSKKQLDYLSTRVSYHLEKMQSHIPDLPEIRKNILKKDVENFDLQFTSANKLKEITKKQCFPRVYNQILGYKLPKHGGPMYKIGSVATS